MCNLVQQGLQARWFGGAQAPTFLVVMWQPEMLAVLGHGPAGHGHQLLGQSPEACVGVLEIQYAACQGCYSVWLTCVGLFAIAKEFPHMCCLGALWLQDVVLGPGSRTSLLPL